MTLLDQEISPVLTIFSGDYISDFSLKDIFIEIRQSIPVLCERNYTYSVQTPSSADGDGAGRIITQEYRLSDRKRHSLCLQLMHCLKGGVIDPTPNE